jgi:hypothetical protein
MSRVATSLNSEKGSAVVWVQPVDVSELLYIPRSGQPKIRSQKYGMVSFTIEHDPGATSIRLKESAATCNGTSMEPDVNEG